mmetsp:Transcript_20269/g.46783  ORF Transcript_20269/g.46783 Transcript_20269/m.46783 type:complete len:385 (-) Transcript_20269:62-1216(-)
MRTKASRSRCFGLTLACSLKTKPEKASLVGSTTSAPDSTAPEVKSPLWFSSIVRAVGGAPISMNASRKSCTPKLFHADPKKSGVISPFQTRRRSSGGSSSSITSASSSSCSYSSSSSMSACSRGSSSGTVPTSSAMPPRCPRAKTCTMPVCLLSTPLKRSPEPIGQSTGVHAMPNSCSISSHTSNGESDGRSSLLTKVKSGSRRRCATSKSFRVCGSRPLAASMSMTALSAAASVRYVSSLKSWWPGVSRMETTRPWYSYWSTVDEMEMPRCCSSSIKSEVARRCSPLALTAPACTIAPPYKSSFSVNVVLPASGCEMIARLRRRSTSCSRDGSSAMHVWRCRVRTTRAEISRGHGDVQVYPVTVRVEQVAEVNKQTVSPARCI